jgi:hypothetical protein
MAKIWKLSNVMPKGIHCIPNTGRQIAALLGHAENSLIRAMDQSDDLIDSITNSGAQTDFLTVILCCFSRTFPYNVAVYCTVSCH